MKTPFIHRKTFVWLAVITGTLSLYACVKRKVYPVEPVVAFKGFTAMNDSGRIVFSFTDGDGDIGLSENETEPASNIFIRYFEKVNGSWVQPTAADGSPVNYDCRTQILTPAGKNKALKGEVMVYVTPYYNPYSDYSDTIKYEIQMADRSMHLSNVVESGEIVR